MKFSLMIAVALIMVCPLVTFGQVVGGYMEISTKDERMVEAVKFAIKSKKEDKVTLEKVVKASSQVVAGTNYRVVLDVKVDGKPRTANAVIWARLDGSYQLSEWKWKDEPKEEKSDRIKK